MKELTVISGKGGTGKTTLVAALASLINNFCLLDCDVDAPDLQIIFEPKPLLQNKFFGSKKALINKELCNNCQLCHQSCHFLAINEKIELIENLCEGCGLCQLVCPQGAISMITHQAGQWWSSTTRLGPLIHALLEPGEENSGKLVSEVRGFAQTYCKDRKIDYLLSDGAPGIGCSVIASLTGTDLALLVTEPTPSGLHSVQRLAQLTKHFKITSVVVINKYDLNLEQTEKIKNSCQDQGLIVVGQIPFDRQAIEAMQQRKTIIEAFPDSELSSAYRQIWQKLEKFLNKQQ